MSTYRRVAFTGTREGLSPYQREQLERWFRVRSIDIFAHGCCIGADIEAHEIARRVYGPALFIAVWPSTAKTRAPIPEDANEVHAPMAPMRRNHYIVAGADVLLACPLEMKRRPRGGTWHAVGCAEDRCVPVEYCWRHQEGVAV